MRSRGLGSQQTRPDRASSWHPMPPACAPRVRAAYPARAPDSVGARRPRADPFRLGRVSYQRSKSLSRIAHPIGFPCRDSQNCWPSLCLKTRNWAVTWSGNSRSCPARRAFGSTSSATGRRPWSCRKPPCEGRQGGLPPRGSTKQGEQRLWRVLAVSGAGAARKAEIAAIATETAETRQVPVADLVVVAEFRDLIYPGLVSTGKAERGGDKPHHIVINGENHHALELPCGSPTTARSTASTSTRPITVAPGTGSTTTTTSTATTPTATASGWRLWSGA